MGAMYRLKAYFGMVPAEELTEYEDEPVERYAAARRGRDPEDLWTDRRGPDRLGGERRVPERRGPDQRWDDQRWAERSRSERTWEDDSWEENRYPDADPADEGTRADEPRRSDEWGGRRTAARTAVAERRRAPSGASAGSMSGSMSGSTSGPVRGALAIDTSVDREIATGEPVRAVAPVVAVSGPVAAPEQRDRVATLARITTLSPSSYKEARTIGERYRDGQPVIMNLTELDAADAKRLVDFAAGLAFALRGGFDKIATRVFLLTPADVEVSADDARKLAERGLFRQD
jgi:cell division inhibitor SepF